MSISVVRRFHMDINGASHALTEDEAIDLARALIAALGSRTIVALADSSDAIVEPVRAATVEPVALPSGPLPESITRNPVVITGAARVAIIEEERERGGIGWKERAAVRCGISTAGIYAYLKRHAGSAPELTPALVPSVPMPESPPIVVDETRAMPGWTLAQTKSLIREMGVGQGGLREAAARTGHTMGSCALRWRHLKEAGLMSVEAYMASPEAVSR